jgi:hypothetical protein
VPEVNPARASQVEVRFEAEGADRTRVSVEHGGWERHGEGGAAYRDQLDRDATWPRILDAFAQVVARRTDAPWLGLTT